MSVERLQTCTSTLSRRCIVPAPTPDMYRQDSREGRIQVVGNTAADKEAQAALQTALLCQILQHNQMQAAHQESALLRELAGTSVMQANVGYGAQPTGPYVGTMEEHLQSRMEAWRKQRRAASQGAPGHFRAVMPDGAQAGHGEGVQPVGEQVWTPLPFSNLLVGQVWAGGPSSQAQAGQHPAAEPSSSAQARQVWATGLGSMGSAATTVTSNALPLHSGDAAAPQDSAAVMGLRLRAGIHTYRAPAAEVAPSQHPEVSAAQAMVAAAPARRTSAPRQEIEAPTNPLADLNSHAKQIQPCHCKKSMCLKLYCDCFASGHYCGETCMCHNCHNTQDHKDLVTQTIAYTRSRNPASFEAKRALARGEHIKGCNCKNSRCLKKYCECFLARARCSSMCRCIGCANQAPDAAEPDKPQKAARVASPAVEPLASAPATKAAPAQAQGAMTMAEAASFRVQRQEQPRAAAAARPAAEWWPARQPARAPLSAERFPLPEAYTLKGAGKGSDDGLMDRRGSIDGTSASEAGTVYGRSATPSPTHEAVPLRLRSSRSVTDDGLSPSTLARTTFPSTRQEAPDQVSIPATPAPSAGPAMRDPDLAQREAAAARVLSAGPPKQAASQQGGYMSLRPCRGPSTSADAGATLTLGGPMPLHPLQKTMSDPFNEGEAAEWLLRLA